MDSAKLVLTEAVSPPAFLEKLSKVDITSEQQEKQLVKELKNFESVFINKLLDEMKNTVGNWGFEKDGTSGQVNGIFYLYLARDIANKGGLGLWKQMYRSLTKSDATKSTTESLDKNI